MKAYKLKIELVGSDPLVWRRLILPADVTFYRLFDTIQIAMGWRGIAQFPHHLFEFHLPEERIRVTNDEDAIGRQKRVKAQLKAVSRGKLLDPFNVLEQKPEEQFRHPRSIKIDTYVEKHGCLEYIYDLLDDRWQHIIRLEAIIDDYPFGYPALLDGSGDCPPEDVGGFEGFVHFMAAISDPRHRDHHKTMKWAAEQNWRKFDLAWTNELLKTVRIHKTEWERLGLGGGHFTLTGRELDRFR